MGNTRQFRGGRRAKVLSQKERIKELAAQVGYQQGLNMAMAAQLEAMKMERPADLDEWVESILPDMDAEEREAFEGLDDEERENFLSRLGQKINLSKALLDAGEQPDPTATEADSEA